MPDDGRRYIRIKSDVDTLFDLDNFNSDDVIRFPQGETLSDPLSKAALSDCGEITAAHASPEEEQHWTRSYGALRAAAARATARLESARATWEQAQAVHTDALRDAYADYKPVQDLIDNRLEEFSRLWEEAAHARSRQESERAAAQQAAEDARLGQRLWVVVVPDLYGPKSPDMLVPIVHRAGCTVLQGKGHEAVRAAVALDAIQRGGPELRRGYRTGRTLHTKLCGRCKPAASLREHLGDLLPNLDRWLEEVDAVQPPLPTVKQLQKAITPWLRYRAGGDGYNLANADRYRAHNLIQPYEEAIGWVKWGEDGTRYLATDAPERLAHLVESLPPLGYVARYFPAVGAEGDELCDCAVAVRRMTPGELRRRAADKVARPN